jgi:hypothetical protein
MGEYVVHRDYENSQRLNTYLASGAREFLVRFRGVLYRMEIRYAGGQVGLEGQEGSGCGPREQRVVRAAQRKRAGVGPHEKVKNVSEHQNTVQFRSAGD